MNPAAGATGQTRRAVCVCVRGSERAVSRAASDEWWGDMFHRSHFLPWYTSSTMTSCHQYLYILQRWGGKGWGFFSPAPALAVPGLGMHGSEKWGMCFCEGHERILWDCAVNYSCWKVPFLAHNPIVNALRVFLLDSPGVYAIDSESISPFVVLKGYLLERLARSNLINRCCVF